MTAKPLHQLTWKTAKRFQWSLQCQQAFDTLKGHLVNPPVLALPIHGLTYHSRCTQTPQMRPLELSSVRNKMAPNE